MQLTFNFLEFQKYVEYVMSTYKKVFFIEAKVINKNTTINGVFNSTCTGKSFHLLMSHE